MHFVALIPHFKNAMQQNELGGCRILLGPRILPPVKDAKLNEFSDRVGVVYLWVAPRARPCNNERIARSNTPK